MLNPTIPEILLSLLQVSYVTLIVLVISALLGLILGTILTVIVVKKIPVLKQITVIFSSFTRSVPIIIQLFIVFYALPPLVESLGFSTTYITATVASIVALTLYHGGYLVEVFRAAYKAIDTGQHEAADSMGYTPIQKFFRITLPQTIPVSLPGWGNALIHLIHDTSLVFALGVVDIMGRGQLIAASSYGINQVQIFLIIAAIYIILTFGSDAIIRFFEKKNKKFKLDSGLNTKGG